MPLPKTQDVGKIITELKRSSTKRPHKQKVAIALDVARKAGANIPKPKKSKHNSSHNPGHETHDENLARRMTT